MSHPGPLTAQVVPALHKYFVFLHGPFAVFVSKNRKKVRIAVPEAPQHLNHSTHSQVVGTKADNVPLLKGGPHTIPGLIGNHQYTPAVFPPDGIRLARNPDFGWDSPYALIDLPLPFSVKRFNRFHANTSRYSGASVGEIPAIDEGAGGMVLQYLVSSGGGAAPGLANHNWSPVPANSTVKLHIFNQPSLEHIVGPLASALTWQQAQTIVLAHEADALERMTNLVQNLDLSLNVSRTFAVLNNEEVGPLLTGQDFDSLHKPLNRRDFNAEPHFALTLAAMARTPPGEQLSDSIWACEGPAVLDEPGS